MCDGTAQSNIGMSYSLQSRNAVAEMVVNQMEAQSYHGAFVLSGCDTGAGTGVVPAPRTCVTLAVTNSGKLPSRSKQRTTTRDTRTRRGRKVRM